MPKSIEPLWVEKYRPKTLDDFVFQDKAQLKLIAKFVLNREIPHLLLSGVQGSGKAQPLYSKILTVGGWKSLRDIKIGDEIIDPSGNISNIEGIYPQGQKEIFEIEFHDGAKTRCCEEHLWECYYIDDYNIRTATKHVVPLTEIINYRNKQQSRTSEHFNVSIPLIQPIKGYDIDLPIDPYLLGVLLGDGCLTNLTPLLSSADDFIVEKVNVLLDKIKMELREVNNIPDNIDYRLVKRDISHAANPITEILKTLGLYNTRSDTKFIPSIYKNGSLSQRISLLQGLMDSDGTKGTSSGISYCSVSKRLAEDVQYLVRSIGGTSTITEKQSSYTYKGKKNIKLSYILHCNHPTPKIFFDLPRKKDKCLDLFDNGRTILRRRIKNITKVGWEESMCIKVSNDDGLYITDDYIVTHNTTISKILVNELELEDCDVLTINGSDENSVDTVREKIIGFVTTFALGKFKIVRIEEADYLSLNAQAVLRHVMEEHQDNARFILTCNYVNKIMPALISRTQHFQFKAFDQEDTIKYATTILDSEDVEYDIDVVSEYAAIYRPDTRKIINELELNTFKNKLKPVSDQDATGDYRFELLDLLKSNNWTRIRALLCENVMPGEWEKIYKFLYDNLDKCEKFQDPTKYNKGILVISTALYRHAIVALPEINAAATFIQLGDI